MWWQAKYWYVVFFIPPPPLDSVWGIVFMSSICHVSTVFVVWIILQRWNFKTGPWQRPRVSYRDQDAITRRWFLVLRPRSWSPDRIPGSDRTTWYSKTKSVIHRPFCMCLFICVIKVYEAVMLHYYLSHCYSIARRRL